jgi:hypothetical protein
MIPEQFAAKIADAVTERISAAISNEFRLLMERFLSAKPDELLTQRQLLDALKVSRTTLKRYVREGMPVERVGERSPRYRLSECLAFHRRRLDERKGKPAAARGVGIRMLKGR